MSIQSKLDQVLALAEKATPGPWGACNQDKGGCICGGVHSVSEDMGVAGTGSIIEDLFCGNREEDADKIAANAVLIASAVNFLRELGPAIRAAVGGEAVAWQFRSKLLTGAGWSDWSECSAGDADYYSRKGAAVQVRQLCTSHTVDVVAIRELLNRIRPGSEVAPWVYNELAALIGKEA